MLPCMLTTFPQTTIVAVAVYFILPNGLADAKFLTPEEREYALRRVHGSGHGDSIHERESHEKFSWSEVRRGFFSFLTWSTAIAYFGILAGLYSFGLFVSCYNPCHAYCLPNREFLSCQPSLPPLDTRPTKPSFGRSYPTLRLRSLPVSIANPPLTVPNTANG